MILVAVRVQDIAAGKILGRSGPASRLENVAVLELAVGLDTDKAMGAMRPMIHADDLEELAAALEFNVELARAISVGGTIAGVVTSDQMIRVVHDGHVKIIRFVLHKNPRESTIEIL